jgi:hypothetical protein
MEAVSPAIHARPELKFAEFHARQAMTTADLADRSR